MKPGNVVVLCQKAGKHIKNPIGTAAEVVNDNTFPELKQQLKDHLKAACSEDYYDNFICIRWLSKDSKDKDGFYHKNWFRKLEPNIGYTM